jgi:catechol 2,3-dioxygenase-like lactoylglutathione lyase family enzyme
MTEITGIAPIGTVVFDVDALQPVASFWADLLGGAITDEDGDWITVTTPNGWDVAFQLAPNLVRPQWPSQVHPQQLHLDLRVLDLAVATEQAVKLGATLLRENAAWNTLADPAGHPFDLCVNAEVGDVTLWAVTFDVPDASAAAAFWSRILGDPVVYDQDGVAMLGGDKPVLFQGVENFTAPHWPDPAAPQQGHLDLFLPDLDAGEAAVMAAGATRLPGHDGDGFRVFADPAGHPFCLCKH